MPDITMCKGGGYDVCQDCYRRTAAPDDFRQAYFQTPPVKGGDCDYAMVPMSDQRTEKGHE